MRLPPRTPVKGVMGLLNKMFGGGTGVEVHLDATQVPVGGILSGRAIVRGGKKDLTLTALNVRLLYVHVEKKDDSPMPSIDTRVLIDNTVTSNQTLPAGAEQEYSFQMTIPPGTEPTAHNVSYQVLVAADIPKVADPTAKVELEVVEGTGDAAALTADAIYARWPALRGTAEQPLIDAMNDMYGAIWQERDELIGAEPVLANLIRQGAGEVRGKALETWAHLLDGRARPENLKLLGEIVGTDLDRDMTESVIEAAAKFADEGALPMVHGYAQHPDASVRKKLAQALHFGGGRKKFPGKRELVVAMAADADAEVRAAAFGALGSFHDDPQIMALCIQHLDGDASPAVQKACVHSLVFCDDKNLALSTLERHCQNPNEVVRREIGENLSWLPKDQAQRVYGLAQVLLSDASQEVRAKTAWYFRNCEKFPQLATLCVHAIENDPAEEVRMDALGSLSSVMPIDQAVAYYRAVLQRDGSRKAHWAVLEGCRYQRDDAGARQLLQELTNSPHERVAKNARKALEA